MLAEPVTPPLRVSVRAVVHLGALTTVVAKVTLALPSMLAEPVTPPLRVSVRAVVHLAASVTAVTGIVTLPAPLKAVAVPVHLPDKAIVRALCNTVAVPALPVTLVTVTFPVMPFTDCTGACGVKICFQLFIFEAGVFAKI